MADTAQSAGVSPQEKGSDPSKPEKATPEEVQLLQAAEAAPDKLSLYIKRCGYGNMVFYEGEDAKGKGVYFVEVARKFVGWDITLRRGGDKTGEPILQLKKAVRFLSLLGWDKGSKMKISDKKADAGRSSNYSEDGSGAVSSRPSGEGSEPLAAEGEDQGDPEGQQAPEELNPSYQHDDSTLALNDKEHNELSNELTASMKQLKVSDPAAAQMTVLQRKHAFRSNRNVFEYNGHTYAWDYKIFVGAVHTLTNLETKEIVAVCKLKAGVTTQSVTAWGLRQNGCLEIIGEGHKMQDMIVATLIGMLEWRKHNNKVWIILLAAMPV